YLRGAGTPRRVSDLSAHRFVLFDGLPQRQQLRLTGPGGEETVHIDGPLIAHDMSFAVDAAAAGIGIALVPDAYHGWAMKGRLRASWKSLVRLLPDFFIEGAELSLVSPPVAYEPARVGLFRDFVAERLGPLMRGCAAAVQQERAERRAGTRRALAGI
ncbi:MAG: LysR substrate-binding domain-containing protein, partial [Pseudomonadota bacterium]